MADMRFENANPAISTPPLVSNLVSRIEIVKDSVVFQKTDAIVNAANSTLLGGGGVDGAIHDAAGPKLYDYFKKLGCTCQPGEAVESPGFNLPAKHIIHTVGPIWHGGRFNEPEVLKRCYENSLQEAAECGCKSISFCSISTGVYRYPLEQAARIALCTVRDWLKAHESNMLVRFCCYSNREYDTYVKAKNDPKLLLLPVGHALDPVEGFIRAERPVSARSKLKVQKNVNAVHPSDVGGFQMGDAIAAMLMDVMNGM